jgi:hypothetical protein
LLLAALGSLLLAAPAAAVEVSLTVSPTAVESGKSATLSWKTSGANSCVATDGWSGAKPLSGSASTGAVTRSTTFKLVCWDANQNTSAASVIVRLTEPSSSVAPTLSFTATPTLIASGRSSSLAWTARNVSSCTAAGAWKGLKPTSGTASTGPLSENTVFKLYCSGSGGTVSAYVIVRIGSTAPMPTISLAATPTRVAVGDSSTLVWTTTNASSCEASGGWSGAKPTSGKASTGAVSRETVYRLRCTGPGGTSDDVATVAVEALSPAPPPPPSGSGRFPLRVAPGVRHLIDARGDPFFVHGDTPWSLIVQATKAQAEAYLEDRRSKKFNAVLVELIEHHFSTNPPKNVYGEGPFLTPGDFSTPNEAYFAHAEYVIKKAAEKGILVMLTPAYMGYGGGVEGWYQEMKANGAAKLRAYGRYLAIRFRDYDNILWVHGGDYNPPDRTLLRAIPNGIRELDNRWLHTFHGSRDTTAREFLGTSEPWLQVNTIYTRESPITEALQQYAASTMPFFLIEAIYEGQGVDARGVRVQAYQAGLSGATGHFMGHKLVWNMLTTSWTAALGSGGARTLSYLPPLLQTYEWSKLQPDVSNRLVTAGIGSNATRVAAGLAADDSVALVYVPTTRTITVALGQLSGPRVRARWYDPTSGAYTTVSGSPFATSTRTFTTPTRNSAGDPDWVLVLESVP